MIAQLLLRSCCSDHIDLTVINEESDKAKFLLNHYRKKHIEEIPEFGINGLNLIFVSFP